MMRYLTILFVVLMLSGCTLTMGSTPELVLRDRQDRLERDTAAAFAQANQALKSQADAIKQIAAKVQQMDTAAKSKP